VIDHFQNAVQVSVDVVIPEAKNFEALMDKMFVSLPVTICMCIEIVLTSVNLDN
jgi:hypothetical protein